jgi:hypothetical protein
LRWNAASYVGAAKSEDLGGKSAAARDGSQRADEAEHTLISIVGARQLNKSLLPSYERASKTHT